MAKKNPVKCKIQDVWFDGYLDHYTTLDEIENIFGPMIKKAKDNNIDMKEEIRIDIGYGTVKVYHFREETDQECEKRLAKEAKEKKMIDDREFRLYQKLAKKYANRP